MQSSNAFALPGRAPIKIVNPTLRSGICVSEKRSRLRRINETQIRSVSGGVGPVGALVGAGLGVVAYGSGTAIGGGFSGLGLLGAAVGGAMIGFSGNPAAGVWAFNGALVTGITGGVGGRLATRHHALR